MCETFNKKYLNIDGKKTDVKIKVKGNSISGKGKTIDAKENGNSKSAKGK